MYNVWTNNYHVTIRLGNNLPITFTIFLRIIKKISSLEIKYPIGNYLYSIAYFHNGRKKNLKVWLFKKKKKTENYIIWNKIETKSSVRLKNDR